MSRLSLSNYPYINSQLCNSVRFCRKITTQSAACVVKYAEYISLKGSDPFNEFPRYDIKLNLMVRLQSLRNMEYPLITITLRFTPIRSDSTS